MNHAASLNDEQIDRLARKRAGMRMAWLIHACVYVLVNVLLVTLSLASGRHWAMFPLLGWGLGLAIHGAVTLLAMPGSGWRERMVQREREQLLAQRAAR